MRLRPLTLVAAVLTLASVVPVTAHPGHTHAPPKKPPPAPAPQAVVALIDAGINPYNSAFRDKSALAQKHPSTYIPGYPRDAIALKLHLDIPYDKAVALDESVWESVEQGELYWVPGTRIVGAISLGSGGTSCPVVPAPPANAVGSGCTEHRILDDHGHGSMTASRAAGAPHSLAPTARIVEVEGLGSASVKWVADQGWIDVQSNSWLSLVPQPVGSATGADATTETFADAAKKMLVLAASGNGVAFSQGAAPTPTYLLSTAAPGVVLVGAHDNGHATLWSGSPPHLVADGYAGWSAMRTSLEVKPDPIACCSSAAAPYAAGGATALVLEARRILGAKGTGIRAGVVAAGKKGLVTAGPLADGVFTLDELKQLLLHTAEARPKDGRDDGLTHFTAEGEVPAYPEYGVGGNPFCQLCFSTPLHWDLIPAEVDLYPFVGYGAVNERSLVLAVQVLRGGSPLPMRAVEDGHYATDQELRQALLGP